MGWLGEVHGVGLKEAWQQEEALPVRRDRGSKFLLCCNGVRAFAEKWNGGGWCPGESGFEKAYYM